MNAYYNIGLDIHKKTISYCIKRVDGFPYGQGKIEANRKSLAEWVKGLPGLGRGNGSNDLQRLGI